MAYLNKNQTFFQKIFFSRGMALFIILVVIYGGSSLFSVIEKSVSASNTRKDAEQKAENLKLKKEKLAQKIDSLSTDEGQESALREQFPLVKQGEHVIVIVNPKEDDKAVKEAPEKGGFWEWIKDQFN